MTSKTDELRQTIALASQILAASGSGDLIWGHVERRVQTVDPHSALPSSD